MIDAILSLIKDAFGWYREKQQAKHELDLANLQAKKEITLSQDKANSDWELAQLNDKDKGLRRAAFILFASPLIAHLLSPKWGSYVDMGWRSMAPWQANTLAGMCLAVFGLKHIPRIVGSTAGAVVSAVRAIKKS